MAEQLDSVIVLYGIRDDAQLFEAITETLVVTGSIQAADTNKVTGYPGVEGDTTFHDVTILAEGYPNCIKDLTWLTTSIANALKLRGGA